MATPNGGYQPRNTPAERRAFFEQHRLIETLAAQNAALEARIAALEDQAIQQQTLTPGTGITFNDALLCRIGGPTGVAFCTIHFTNNTGGALSALSPITFIPGGWSPVGADAPMTGMDNDNQLVWCVAQQAAGLGMVRVASFSTTVEDGDQVVIKGFWSLT